MRRKDRERDPAFAWSIFDRASYGVLSMRDEEGGYGVPISPARIGETVYFHCAMKGKKLDCLAKWPEATLTTAEAGEADYFSVCFASAILRGTVVIVDSESEKREALIAITRRYCPGEIRAGNGKGNAADIAIFRSLNQLQAAHRGFNIHISRNTVRVFHTGNHILQRR